MNDDEVFNPPPTLDPVPSLDSKPAAYLGLELPDIEGAKWVQPGFEFEVPDSSAPEGFRNFKWEPMETIKDKDPVYSRRTPKMEFKYFYIDGDRQLKRCTLEGDLERIPLNNDLLPLHRKMFGAGWQVKVGALGIERSIVYRYVSMPSEPLDNKYLLDEFSLTNKGDPIFTKTVRKLGTIAQVRYYLDVEGKLQLLKSTPIVDVRGTDVIAATRKKRKLIELDKIAPGLGTTPQSAALLLHPLYPPDDAAAAQDYPPAAQSHISPQWNYNPATQKYESDGPSTTYQTAAQSSPSPLPPRLAQKRPGSPLPPTSGHTGLESTRDNTKRRELGRSQ